MAKDLSNLPGIPDAVPQVRAPEPTHMSARDIAAPYLQLSEALEKRGRALDTVGQVLMEDIAKPAAKEAGFQAVTRDSQGNLKIDKVPVFGAAADVYRNAVDMAALSTLEGEASMKSIEMRQKYQFEPEGY